MNSENKIPCEECISFAICKQKEIIVCSILADLYYKCYVEHNGPIKAKELMTEACDLFNHTTWSLSTRSVLILLPQD